MSVYIAHALRTCFGAVAGVLKIPVWTASALINGKRPPSFKRAPSIGASVLGEVFEDTSFKSQAPDELMLHAVQDDGKRQCPGKRAIVFVHGFPELWLSWKAQLHHFAAQGHPVVALSMRGYGLSEKPAEIERYHLFEYLVPDVQAAVAHAQRRGSSQKPLLVAHDWGAGVCWPAVGLSMTSHAEVAGYASLANPPGEAFMANFSFSQLWASLYMVFFNAPGLPEALFLANSAWFTGLLLNWTEKPGAVDAETLNIYRTAVLQPGAMTAQLNYYRAAIQLSPKAANGNILKPNNKLKLPVLLIRGKQDVALLGGLFKDLDRYLENYSLLELDGCSHWIQHDAPEEVNESLEHFLQQLHS